MKASNSLGSVELICSKKDKKKRSRPFRVRYTIGWEIDEENLTYKPIRKTIGYASTYGEGDIIRKEYNDGKFSENNVSFEFLFLNFYEHKKKKIKTHKRYLSYIKYYDELKKKKFQDITFYDLQNIIDTKMDGLSLEYQEKVMLVYHEMWEFAKGNNVSVNADASKLVIKNGVAIKNPHKIIENQDIKTLWNNKDNNLVKIWLCMIYTGVRPNEMLVISEVNDDYFITGSKTEAGKDRVIPLHIQIKQIFHEVYNSGILKTYKTEDNLYQASKKMLLKYGLEKYTPYDCRHTFATLCDKYELDEHSIKLILGHYIEDLTKRVYTHKSTQTLINEVNKIKIDI